MGETSFLAPICTDSSVHCQFKSEQFIASFWKIPTGIRNPLVAWNLWIIQCITIIINHCTAKKKAKSSNHNNPQSHYITIDIAYQKIILNASMTPFFLVLFLFERFFFLLPIHFVVTFNSFILISFLIVTKFFCLNNDHEP